MAWESDPEEVKEVRDRTWIWWAAIILIAVGGLVVLMTTTRTESGVSRVRARHILIAYDRTNPESVESALQFAQSLRERIQKGESFGKLARQHSADSWTGGRSGDIGWRLKGELEDAVEGYIWVAPLRELSEPIRGETGYHLIEVLDREFSPADRYEMELRQRAQ